MPRSPAVGRSPIPFTRTFNNSLEFSGSTSQYMTFGNNLAKENTDAFSFSYWIRSTGALSDPRGAVSVLNKIQGATNGYGFEFNVTNVNGQFVGITFVDASGQTQIRGNFPGLVGTWYFVVSTYDGTGLSLSSVKHYVNGVLLSNTISGGAYGGATLLNSTNAVMLRGTYVPLSSGQLVGQITEMRLHNTALTAAEASDLYFANIPSHVQDYWPLTEGSGSSIADTVGGITGTLVSSPTWSAVNVPSIKVRDAVTTPRNPVV